MNTCAFNHSSAGVAASVCLRCLQTVGFALNVGQQHPSYVKGRQAGRCEERAAGGCAAVTMEEAVAHIRLPEHCWRWAGRDADSGGRRTVPMMKTVLSLHRKWAHAVKTIRILQGLVSVTLIPWLWFDHIFGVCSWTWLVLFWPECSIDGLSWMMRWSLFSFFALRDAGVDVFYRVVHDGIFFMKVSSYFLLLRLKELLIWFLIQSQ